MSHLFFNPSMVLPINFKQVCCIQMLTQVNEKMVPNNQTFLLTLNVQIFLQNSNVALNFQVSATTTATIEKILWKQISSL